MKKMKYTITGNFQYDLGVYGLKKILDFFDEKYVTDGQYYIELEKTPEELVILALRKNIISKKYVFFRDKLLEPKKFNLSINNDEYLDGLDINKKWELEVVVENISKHFQQEKTKKKEKKKDSDKKPKEYNGDNITNEIWGVAAEILNRTLLNFYADKSSKDNQKAFYKSLEKLYPEKNDANLVCSFCGKHKGKPISRDTFLNAPSALNFSWFNQQLLSICPYCIALNFAFVESLTFFGNSKENAFAIYTPNLQEMANLESIFSNKSSSFALVSKNIIEYEKNRLKEKALSETLQIVEFTLSSKKPNTELYILDKRNLEKIYEAADLITRLFEKNPYGKIKQGKNTTSVDIAKDIFSTLSHNQNFSALVYKYIYFVVRSYIEKIKFDKDKKYKPNAVGFKPEIFLLLLQIDFKIKGGLRMAAFEVFNGFGQSLRKAIIDSCKNGDAINWDTANNKLISLANKFITCSKMEMKDLQILITQQVISYHDSFVQISVDEHRLITKESFSDISTTIALSLLSNKEKQDKNNTAENLEESDKMDDELSTDEEE